VDTLERLNAHFMTEVMKPPAFDTITLYIFDFAEDRVESEGSVSFTNINLVLMEDHKGWHKKFTCSLINSARINPFDMENAKNIRELGRFVNLIKTQPNKYRLSIKYRDGVNITRISDAMLLGSMFPEELLSNSSIGQAIRIEFIDTIPILDFTGIRCIWTCYNS